MKVYLAGPMNGLPDHNYPAFFDAATDLRVKGHEVVSPAEMHGEDPGGPVKPGTTYTWEQYLARDLPHVIEADGVVVLPGWKASRGAKLELLVAASLGKPVFAYPTLTPLDVEVETFASLRTTDGATRIEGYVEAALNLRDAAKAVFSRNHSPHMEVVAEECTVVPESVLIEADRLINGDRQAAYSHPLDSFNHIGRLWGAFLLNLFEKHDWVLLDDEGEPMELMALDAEEVALMMDQLKVAREVDGPKRDNRVDGPGYWGCIELILRERERRGQ